MDLYSILSILNNAPQKYFFMASKPVKSKQSFSSKIKIEIQFKNGESKETKS